MTAPGAVLVLLALHGLAALVAGPLFRLLGRRAFVALAAVPGALFIWCLLTAVRLPRQGGVHTENLRWARSLHFELAIRVDWFALLMLGIVSGVGTLVLIYSAAYFRSNPPAGGEHGGAGPSLGGTARIARIGGLIVAFAGAMAGIVASDNLLAIFLFWELTSVTSYLLIGTEDHSASARAAALRSYVTTAAGGLAMLAGFILLADAGGSWSLTFLLRHPPKGPTVGAALVLILLGAFTKSAQFPFHFWLPPAMAAPTPVSAYLHSATMVKAGVYLIARFAGPFSDAAQWKPLVITVGAVTMLLGARRALSQRDLKLILAHGTVSQLGFMVLLFGVGDPATIQAGVILLFGHSLFKAALFMAVGTIDHSTGTRDINQLPNLWPSMRITVLVTVIAAASMAGVPPLLGFIAKEAALDSLLVAGSPAGLWALIAVVGGSVLTVGYSARIVGGILGRFSAQPSDGVPIEGTSGLVGPGAILALLTALLGVAPLLISPLVSDVVRSLGGPATLPPIAIWHGFVPSLGLSALVLVAGGLVWFGRDTVARLEEWSWHPISGARLFDIGFRGLLRRSDQLIGRVQTGSLPFYLLVVLATTLVLPGFALIRGDLPVLSTELMDDPGQVVIVAVVIIAAIGAVVVRHRLGAVLCVGATGYGVAAMFMYAGAPDLALTQMLVETLALVVFVLVLRHLPKRFAFNQTAFAILQRALLSVAVGVGAAAFTLYSYAARPSSAVPVSQNYIDSSPETGGQNIVNVILVEFRAFDTFGEISVLTVAALGILGLTRAVKRQRGEDGERVEPLRPSFVLDAAVYALFQTLLVVSVILLLGGHDEPGGGFIAGLVAGSAFLLVYLTGGDEALRQREPLAAEVFLGSGLVAAFGAGALGWIGGGTFLEERHWESTLPILGNMKISTPLVFEMGVYLVVLGVVMALLRSLGREEVYEL